jgi:hypothetical protein
MLVSGGAGESTRTIDLLIIDSPDPTNYSTSQHKTTNASTR